MSRKTSEKQKLSGADSNTSGIGVPLTVEVRGVGAAGEAVAKVLDAGRAAVTGAGDAKAAKSRVLITDVAGAADAVRVVGEQAAPGNTWIALLTDKPLGAELGEFEQALEGLGSDAVDLVLLVEPERAADLIAAWTVVKADAPVSVLSRLPDSEGAACRYVALTGIVVVGAGGASDGEAGDIANSDGWSGPALREAMREFVRDNADGVREARAKVAAAVVAGSASQVLSASAELDVAVDALQEQSLEGLDVPVSKFVDTGLNVAGAEGKGGEAAVEVAGEESEPANAATAAIDLDALIKARAAALSDFLLVASKGGLGKLFAKTKLKQTGDSLLKATDAYVEGQGAELIDELTELAEPLVDALHQDQLQQAAAANSVGLVQQATQAAATLKPVMLADPAKINRAWTTGAPAPRKYLLASSSTLDASADASDLDVSFFAVPLDDLDGAYILQAQYALSKTAVSA